MEKRPDKDLEPRRTPGRPAGQPGRKRNELEEVFGIDVEALSPRGQVIVSGAVLAAVLVGVGLVLSLVPQLFWLVFTFGWLLFPAFGLLLKGIAGLADDDGAERLPKSDVERELLRALEEHGELTPTRAAMETSLSVAEADRMLKELTEAGHLEVRARGGGLFYALWGAEDGGTLRGVEGRL